MAGTQEAGDADKEPRTERGRRTRRSILDAAAAEFGERGFHDASISGITRRAGVALGSFYTYFNSKDVVFRALVRDLSDQVREHVGPTIRAAGGGVAAERAGLESFLRFVRAHKEIYRIIDEAEFVDPDSFRLHYRSTAERIAARLAAGVEFTVCVSRRVELPGVPSVLSGRGIRSIARYDVHLDDFRVFK